MLSASFNGAGAERTVSHERSILIFLLLVSHRHCTFRKYFKVILTIGVQLETVGVSRMVTINCK